MTNRFGLLGAIANKVDYLYFFISFFALLFSESVSHFVSEVVPDLIYVALPITYLHGLLGVSYLQSDINILSTIFTVVFFIEFVRVFVIKIITGEEFFRIIYLLMYRKYKLRFIVLLSPLFYFFFLAYLPFSVSDFDNIFGFFQNTMVGFIWAIWLQSLIFFFVVIFSILKRNGVH